MPLCVAQNNNPKKYSHQACSEVLYPEVLGVWGANPVTLPGRGAGAHGLKVGFPRLSLLFSPSYLSSSSPPAPPPTLAGAHPAAPHLSGSVCSFCPQAAPHLSRSQTPWWRRGQIAPRRRAGCRGHPAPRAWAAGTSFATAKLVPSWGGGWGGGLRVEIGGASLTPPSFSLAEDAELVQRKCLPEMAGKK